MVLLGKRINDMKRGVVYQAQLLRRGSEKIGQKLILSEEPPRAEFVGREGFIKSR